MANLLRRPAAAAVIILAVSMLLLPSCRGKQQPVTPEDAYLYDLVGEPCSEGDYTTAISRADSLLSSVSMSDSVRAFIMIDRLVSLSNMGALERARDYSDTVIDYGKSAHIDLAVMQGLQARGMMSRRFGDYASAVADLEEGMEIAVSTGDKEMEQVFAEMFSIIYAERLRTDEALDFGRRAMRLSLEAGDTAQALASLSTIGACLANDGKYREAIAELLPWKSMLPEMVPVVKVKYLTPLIKSYTALDSLARVREIISIADSAAAQLPPGHQTSLVVNDANAELARKEGRYADQLRYLQRADSFPTMGKMPQISLNTRAQCLAHLGRYAEAYDYSRKAFEALDSVSREDTDKKLSEISVKYETLQKDMEIETLRNQRLVWLLIALGAVAALAVITALAISARRRAKRKLEQQRAEEYLRGIEQERERIARELHDDIAGDLIGLQWKIDSISADEAAEQIADVGKRVRRLSHELMPPQFSSFDFSQLLLDFTARFNASHSAHSISLTDEGSFPWQSLSPEQSHELYRIVQEAVNNAVKHGLPGEICITLRGDSRFSLSVENPAGPGSSDPGMSAGLRILNARADKLRASLEASLRDAIYTLNISQDE